MNNKGIIGAIIGDIVGSRFEWDNCRSTDFEFLTEQCTFTDDTVMTIAVAEWLTTKENLSDIMRNWGKSYPERGYGGMFYRWLFSRDPEMQKPYNSFGNGAGMRVSPCGFYACSLEQSLQLAKESADVSHNHPEGVKGAQSIASAIYLARIGRNKTEIKSYIERVFGYDLGRTCDEIRPVYQFNETCQGSCPEAIIAFLESDSYESAVRLAISLGGDSDTIACMTGGIAAAYYGVPDEIIDRALPFLPQKMIDVILHYEAAIPPKSVSTDDQAEGDFSPLRLK